MLEQPKFARDEAAELLGDLHPLVEQLGSVEGLVTLSQTSASVMSQKIETVAQLQLFLERYQRQLLVPVELPFIQRAYTHAHRSEVRELIALDKELNDEAVLKPFAFASLRVGASQLRRLLPLRDSRVVQRYSQAVDTGAAVGWHMVVYGLTLALYSIPLRQGLLNYAYQTQRGFLHSAARSFHLSEARLQEIFERLCASFPGIVDGLLAQPPDRQLECC